MSAAAGNRSQLRHTQPPSKVLHVRNLPRECSEGELVELCHPFGRVSNTKLNVGANHNQAFVEFTDLNQAISMVSYYASSPEPAQIRGKSVYLQYSTRQEIVATKASGDSSSNVLLVTIEGVEAGDISIDVIHLVFSAFGFVHKIATFEKAAGFQALVQFGDAGTALNAKTNLEGRSIPKYLVPQLSNVCYLRISFSAHTDLHVKFQSHKSRDYTNLHLPVAPSVTENNDEKIKTQNTESNVLLVTIEPMEYSVTIDVLHKFFSPYGKVQKIAIFDKFAIFQALIQYPDIQTAVTAKNNLEGQCIYDGGFCKLKLSFSKHTNLNVRVNNERSRDYTRSPSTLHESNPKDPTQPPATIKVNSETPFHHSSPTQALAFPFRPPQSNPFWEQAQAQITTSKSSAAPMPPHPAGPLVYQDPLGRVQANPSLVPPYPSYFLPYFGPGHFNHPLAPSGYNHTRGQHVNGVHPLAPPGPLGLGGSLPIPPGSIYHQR